MNIQISKLGGDVSNAGESVVQLDMPFSVGVQISGVAPILFHRWQCDAVAAKSAAKKGSAAKKEDDWESYLYRLPNGNLALPGEYVRQAIIMAAKFKQDPRSPRKSAMDLLKAGVLSLTDLADLGAPEPDYLDRRRVVIQRSGITRVRPAMNTGWKASVSLQVMTPEYIDVVLLREVIDLAGRLVGVGDFRPTFGRFVVNKFEVETIQ